jgi:glutamate synthase (NADPH) large chain
LLTALILALRANEFLIPIEIKLIILAIWIALCVLSKYWLRRNEPGQDNPMKNIRTDLPDEAIDGYEKDSCAIYMSARKHGQSTFGTLKRALGALMNMGHRTGFVSGEGDGAGVQTDIPRRLWAKNLSQAGIASYLATRHGFWVGHLFTEHDASFSDFSNEIALMFNEANLNLLIHRPGRVRMEVLGQNARISPPSFWQIVGFCEADDLEERLLDIRAQIEERMPVHFASLSSDTVIYKIRGSVETLIRYFPDLQDRNYDTAIVLCHARYSTNTVSTFERAQPFAILGHNGEINTVSRLRIEGQQIGARLPAGGSDSQDLDRILHTLCVKYNLSLVEAMEMVFPPPPYEVEKFPPDLRATYHSVRQAFGPYAQGPAAIVARYGNTIVGSVDALGLRPLWFVETEKEYVFTSERGAVPLEVMISDAKPLSPGEKLAIEIKRGENPEVLHHEQIRQHVMVQSYQREAPQHASRYWSGWSQLNSAAHVSSRNTQGSQHVELLTALRADTCLEVEYPLIDSGNESQMEICPWKRDTSRKLDIPILSANGWLQEHVKDVSSLTSGNKDDLISSLGYDGPLAALSKVRVNLADYYKESIAVVTNPAIDQAREMEVFSTSSLVGACPPVGFARNPEDILMVLNVPVVLGGYQDENTKDYTKKLARQYGTLTLEDLMQVFECRRTRLIMSVLPGEEIRTALIRLRQQAVAAVLDGVQCILLDDSETIEHGYGWIDPLLGVSVVDDALRIAPEGPAGNLRRRTGVVVRSAAVRNLHDLALLCGFGADAINPYAMVGIGLKQIEKGLDDEDAHAALSNLMKNVKDGLEKVTSTMGCHELRGYGRVCGSIGLSPEVAETLGTPNYFGSDEVGVTWAYLDKEAESRSSEITGKTSNIRLGHVSRFNPRIWKSIAAYAEGKTGFVAVQETYQKLMNEMPVALRHIIGIRHVSDIISPYDVDISVNEYSLPIVIDAMSYGSQGEKSFKTYARAAAELNIICVNGEGGELDEIMGVYKQNRGQQVASGRFGVNVEFLNSAAVLEIKIGQGAKPGEGGMLPAFKVTEKVAKARRTPPGVTLISPSNNHDLYSIEDLAQLIEELRAVAPEAKISVKVPVVPGIGVIAVGIAKAGADIINISGYDGGTGAARKHSLQYAGLPTEIGIIQAHRALLDAGLRHRVEIWANGGMKTGQDVVKMVLLGANRVGFATVAMVAIGCTICRDCNLGTCHVGIATQIQTIDEAREKGLKHFHPQDEELAVSQLVRTLKGIGEEVRQLSAQLGEVSLQNIVGRADLLEQVALKERIDLSAMFEPTPIRSRVKLQQGVGILLIRPRNSLTTILTDLMVKTAGENEREMTYQDSVTAIDRALGSRLAGELARNPKLFESVDVLHLRFGPSAIAGNGFAAWTSDKLDILIEGGAQDGVAKGSSGGRVAIMKGLNHDGERIDGSVGKSFAYGAQGGILIVQGNADSRACVRLSGAKVLIGGEITRPLYENHIHIGATANIKGFACEYMTSGTVVILGDPGPYAFSGMTGGVVYQLLTPYYGFDVSALQQRIANGAQVSIKPVEKTDIPAITEILDSYAEALEQTYQYEFATKMHDLCGEQILLDRFVKVIPDI